MGDSRSYASVAGASGSATGAGFGARTGVLTRSAYAALQTEPLRRPNTVVISIPAELSRKFGKQVKAKVIKALCDVVPAEHIKCMQPMGSDVRVTLSSSSHKTTVLSEGLVSESLTLPVREAEVNSTFVHIHRLPYEVLDSDLTSLLNFYGNVLEVKRVRDASLPGCESGSRIVKIVLRDHIPRLLRLRGFWFTAFYRGQPEYCASCRFSGHSTRECPMRGVCWNCRESGHLSRSCPYPPQGESESDSESGSEEEEGEESMETRPTPHPEGSPVGEQDHEREGDEPSSRKRARSQMSPSEGGPRSGSLSGGEAIGTQSTTSPPLAAERGSPMPSQNTSEPPSGSASQVGSDWASRVLREEQQEHEGGQVTSCTGVSRTSPHGSDPTISEPVLSVGDSTLGQIATPPSSEPPLSVGDSTLGQMSTPPSSGASTIQLFPPSGSPGAGDPKPGTQAPKKCEPTLRLKTVGGVNLQSLVDNAVSTCLAAMAPGRHRMPPVPNLAPTLRKEHQPSPAQRKGQKPSPAPRKEHKPPPAPRSDKFRDRSPR